MGKVQGSRAFHNARLRKQRQKDLHNADGKFAQAVALHQQGSIAAAQALYRDILETAPDHFDALYFSGVAAFQTAQYQVADQFLKRALKVDPQSSAAHSTHAAILYELGRFAEALARCEHALTLAPGDADALNFRGNALARLDRLEEAVASYDKALALKPDFVGALNNRGNALNALKRFDQALATFGRAIALAPHYPDAVNNRGNVLKELARYDDAIADYDRAITIKPDYAEAHSNRGIALVELGRGDEALASFDRALALRPDLPAALNGRGNALRALARYEEALASFEEAIALQPDFAEAFGNRGIALTELMRFDEALASLDKAIAIKPSSPIAISNKIVHLDFAGVGFEKQQAARRQWWENVGAKIAAASTMRHANVRDPERRLVVGYVSSDFRQHSAAVTIRPVLRHHDRSQFQVICYSGSAVEDEVTRDFRGLADIWRDATRDADQHLGEKIQADKVDVLVDLSGHSAGNRLSVFALKPAPVQITAWGHATGTGLPTIDYLFSDPVAIPASVRPLFTETIYDLPCMVTMEQPPDALRCPDAPVVRNGHVTFGVFNRVSKISDAAIAAWSRILRETPQSSLLIKDVALDSAFVRERLHEKFAEHGIGTDRVGMLGRTGRDEHLMAFRHVDICLDPFPWGGGVSTWEALHMGVPVVAMLGNGISSRVAAAIASAIGLSDWVADDVEDYIALAVRFAAQPDALVRLRRELPPQIANAAAGNSVAYTRAVENAYRAMWKNYCLRKT